ncbi:MAG: type II toxin-antitoxin system RelE/ParE family toxin [Gammaproteobacteria bacterium]
MTIPVIIRPEAELDLAAAQIWYEAEREGLGLEFRAAVSHSIELIRSHALMFPTVLRTIRRALLIRFPYALFFEPEEGLRAAYLACSR